MELMELHMPEAQLSHGAEIINDEIFVFGGYGKEDKILSSLIKIDPRSLKIKAMPPLPHPLAGMATVRWRDEVVFLGGYDDREILNNVIMFGCKSGKITLLSPHE